MLLYSETTITKRLPCLYLNLMKAKDLNNKIHIGLTSIKRISKNRRLFELDSGTVPTSMQKLKLAFLQSNGCSGPYALHEVDVALTNLDLSVV